VKLGEERDPFEQGSRLRSASASSHLDRQQLQLISNTSNKRI
jgi:hypothetical protein